MTVDQRLDRIEDKMDTMATTLTTLAEVTVRIEGVVDNQARHELRLNSHAKCIGELEKKSILQGAIGRTGERIFWLIFSALVGALVFHNSSGPLV